MSSILDRSKAPSPSLKNAFTPPPFLEYFLQNGSRVIFQQKLGLPITVVTFIVEAGTKYDPQGGEGLAQLTASLLDEGAGEWDALQLNALLESRGLSLSVMAGNDDFEVSISGLSEDVDLMMKIVSEVVYDPHFKLEDFEREQDKIRNGIQQSKNQPQAMAWKLFGKIVQGRPNAYTSVGATEESIEEMTLSDVTFFHSERIEPTKPTFTIVTNLDYSKIEASIETHFKGRLGVHEAEKVDTAYALRDLRIFILDRKDAPQTEILGGFPMDPIKLDDTDLAISLVNNIFGGHFNSRLIKNLREEKGYTYGIHSFMLMNRQSGQYMVSTSVDTQNTGAALLEILKEMNLIRKEISEEELTFVKNQSTKSETFMFETYGMISALQRSIVQRDLPLDYFSVSRKRYNDITLDDAITSANKFLLLENMQIILVGDLEEIVKTIPNPLLRGVVEVNDNGKVILREQP